MCSFFEENSSVHQESDQIHSDLRSENMYGSSGLSLKLVSRFSLEIVALLRKILHHHKSSSSSENEPNWLQSLGLKYLRRWGWGYHHKDDFP